MNLTTNSKFEQFEQLLLKKKFVELDSKEKDVITEFCNSETEYDQMQSMMLQFQNNINASVKNLNPSYSIYSDLQVALNNKWNKTSYTLNSIFDSLTSWLQVENYIFKTSLAALTMLIMVWFSFKSESGISSKNLNNIIIADSSYKNNSCDSSFVKIDALAP